MLTDLNMLSRVKALERELQIKSSTHINETLTNEELKTAAEMFLYLNMCPDKIKPWIAFYKDLFQTQSSDQIILSLNRLLKGTATQNEYLKNLAEKLLKRILSMLPGRKIENTEFNVVARKSQKLEGIEY